LMQHFSDEVLAAGAERVFPISAATGAGIEALFDALLEYLPRDTATEKPEGVDPNADSEPGVWSPV
ncbi:MAG: GTPase ObgE, partial [Blastomonas fulva]